MNSCLGEVTLCPLCILFYLYYDCVSPLLVILQWGPYGGVCMYIMPFWGRSVNSRLKLMFVKWISVVSVKLMTIHESIGFSVCFL